MCDMVDCRKKAKIPVAVLPPAYILFCESCYEKVIQKALRVSIEKNIDIIPAKEVITRIKSKWKLVDD